MSLVKHLNTLALHHGPVDPGPLARKLMDACAQAAHHIEAQAAEIDRLRGVLRGIDNARLIAAAPDLLEALETLLSYAPKTYPRRGGVTQYQADAQQARTAIVKAKS